MDIERHPAITCICIFFMIFTIFLLAMPCLADSPDNQSDTNGTLVNSWAPAVFSNNTTVVSDMGGGAADNGSPPEAAEPEQVISGVIPLDDGNDSAAPPAPVCYVIRGTIYSDMAEGRMPWPGGDINVYVDGVPADVEGSSYSAVIDTPTDGDFVDVRMAHDGYVLGRASGLVDLSKGSTCIDVDAQALEISGDVYIDDVPADGASVFIYLDDHPIGPFRAVAGNGPMFSVSIPDGHLGDHVSITASKGDRSGIVSQDAQGYQLFLTVNLKNSNTYMPYTDRTMAGMAGQAAGRVFLTAGPPRSKYDSLKWLQKNDH